jgi:GNAT superfamily N-acetyltransferase
MAARLAAYAVGHRALARELVVTRGHRYARGITRIALTRLRRPSPSSSGSAASHKVGEITHLFVQPDRQGSGIGRALVNAAVETARAAGVEELVLMTPPDFATRSFYERTGWWADGEMSSRSRESFIRYRLSISTKVPKGGDRADADGSSPVTC